MTLPNHTIESLRKGENLMDYDAVAAIAKRDGITTEEAKEIVGLAIEEVMAAIKSGNILEADEIWQSETGLEPDYLYELIM